MAPKSANLAGDATDPTLDAIIDIQKVQQTLLGSTVSFTTNQFVYHEDIRPADIEPLQLASADFSRSQLLVRIESANGVFAVKCIASGKSSRRQRETDDHKHSKAVVARKRTGSTEKMRQAIYDKAVEDGNDSAWNDHEVQNYMQFIMHSDRNVLDLSGFAYWKDPDDIKDGLLFLCYEHCEAGTLQDYIENCRSRRHRANESFVMGRVALQLVSAIEWLQKESARGLRPALSHRNIRPKNVFLKNSPEPGWPIVKLGGFENLTPFKNDVNYYESKSLRSRWDAPEFPAISKASDIWSVGAVIYATLTYGRIPPPFTVIPSPIAVIDPETFVFTDTDPETSFEDSPLDPYHDETRNILRDMLMTVPSRRLSAEQICRLISKAEETRSREEKPATWDGSEKEPARELISELARGYLILLEPRVQKYLMQVHSLACLGPDEGLYVAPPGIEMLKPEILAALTQWSSKAFPNNEKPELQDRIPKAGRALAAGIRANLEEAGKEFLHLVRRHFFMIPRSQRDKLVGHESVMPAMVIQRIEAFMSYIRPAVEDFFWTLSRDPSETYLNVFPTTDLIITQVQNKFPSFGEICVALQSRIMEICYMGMLEAVYNESNSRTRKQERSSMDKVAARLAVHFDIWFGKEKRDIYTTWLEHLCERLKSLWKASFDCLEKHKSKPSSSTLAELYQFVVDFASDLVPVSTICLSVTASKQEEHEMSYDNLIRFIGYVQKNWKNNRPLYPPRKELLQKPVDNGGPTMQPSFNSIGVDLLSMSKLQSRLQRDIEKALEPLALAFARKILVYHVPPKASINRGPEQHTDYDKDLEARKLADMINIKPPEGELDDLGQQKRSAIAHAAAHKAILREFQARSSIPSQARMINVKKQILQAIWRIDYAAAICSAQRKALRSNIYTGLVRSGRRLRRLEMTPNTSQVQTQINRYIRKIHKPLTVLHTGLGFPEDCDWVQLAVQHFAHQATLILMQWKETRRMEDLKIAAVPFAAFCDNMFPGHWIEFRDNYVRYVLHEAGPELDLADVQESAVSMAQRAAQRVETQSPDYSAEGSAEDYDDDNIDVDVDVDVDVDSGSGSGSDDTSFGWSDLGKDGVWPDSPEAPQQTVPPPRTPQLPAAKPSVRKSKQPQTPSRLPRDSTSSTERIEESSGDENDDGGGGGRDRNLVESRKAITTSKAKGKQQNTQASQRVSKGIYPGSFRHPQIFDSPRIRTPSGQSQASSQPSIKRESPFSLEGSNKRLKPWDGVTKFPEGSTSWGDVGRAFVQVVPGVKNVAKTAGNFVGLFSSPLPETTVSRGHVFVPSPDSAVPTYPPEEQVVPRPASPKTPVDQISKRRYRELSDGLSSGYGARLHARFKRDFTAIQGHGIEQISREALNKSLAAHPNSTSLKLIEVTQLSSPSAGSRSPVDLPVIAINDKQLKPPIQFMVHKERLPVSSEDSNSSGSNTFQFLGPSQQAKVLGSAAFKDNPDNTDDHTSMLNQSRGSGTTQKLMSTNRAFPASSPEGTSSYFPKNMFRWIPGKGLVMNRATAPEVSDLERPLSDDQQIKNEDTQWDQQDERIRLNLLRQMAARTSPDYEPSDSPPAARASPGYGPSESPPSKAPATQNSPDYWPSESPAATRKSPDYGPSESPPSRALATRTSPDYEPSESLPSKSPPPKSSSKSSEGLVLPSIEF